MMANHNVSPVKQGTSFLWLHRTLYYTDVTGRVYIGEKEGVSEQLVFNENYQATALRMAVYIRLYNSTARALASDYNSVVSCRQTLYNWNVLNSTCFNHI